MTLYHAEVKQKRALTKPSMVSVVDIAAKMIPRPTPFANNTSAMRISTIVAFVVVVCLATAPCNAQGHIIDPKEHETKTTGDNMNQLERNYHPPISDATAGMSPPRIRGFSYREQINRVVTPRRPRNINNGQHRHHPECAPICHLCHRVLQYGSTSAGSQFKQKLVHFRTHLEYEYQKLPSDLGLFLLITSFVLFLACVCCCFTAPFFLCYDYFLVYQIDRALDMEDLEDDVKVDTDEDSSTSTEHDDDESLSAVPACYSV